MKLPRQLCVLAILMAIFTLPVFADGQMQTPCAPQPSSLITEASPTGEETGETDPVVQAFLNILQGLMFLV